VRANRLILPLVAVIVLLGGVAWFVLQSLFHPSPPATPSLPAEEVGVSGMEVTLYLVDGDKAMLAPVRRHLDHSPADSEAIVQELAAGPEEGQKLQSPLPKGTRLIGSALKDGVLTLNFNEDFRKNFPSSSAGSLMAVYSLVNTLTLLPGIDKVSFQVEGEPVSELGGLDLSEPLAPESSYVIEKK